MATLLYSIAFPNVRAASLGFRPRFACVRSPHDPIEDRLEFPSARRIDRAQMRDPPREKGAEVQAILAILRLGSGSKGGPMTEVRMKICRYRRMAIREWVFFEVEQQERDEILEGGPGRERGVRLNGS